MQQCASLLSTPTPTKTKGSTPRSKPSLPSQEFAKPENLLAVQEDFKQTCEREVSWWIKHLRLYLENEQTVKVLIPPLQSQIVDDYTRFRDMVVMEYPREVQERLMSSVELWALLRGAAS